jgi:hypothetical protein
MKWRRKNGRLQCVVSSYHAAVWNYEAGTAAGTQLRCSIREECLRRGEIVDIMADNGNGGVLIERYDGKLGKVLKWT